MIKYYFCFTRKNMFRLISNFQPTGDQPHAIEKLSQGLKKGFKYQTLLGVTGSGKTYTMAKVIEELQRPALILSPNKILAAQLYQEFKSFFPNNHVHYFVSYYDYYQPEAYLPATDTYIAKDAKINDILDQLRHAAIESTFNNKDFIIVSSISCIYGIGDPEEYENICLELMKGQKINPKEIINYLKVLQYQRKKTLAEIKPASYVWDKDKKIIYIFNPDGTILIEIEFIKEVISSLKRSKILSGKNFNRLKINKTEEHEKIKIFPAKFFITSKEKLELAILNIKAELKERYWQLLSEGKIVEAERLKQRTLVDITLLEKQGYCSGIENYSRHLSFRQLGEPPFTLLDYLPKETIIFIDESHLALPQLKAMASGDRRRKEVLIEYGWRLSSALDNRPLTFDEFFNKNFQIIFVSATPGHFEKEHSYQIVEQLIRPTGIVDPEIEVRPTKNQVIDLIKEIKKRINRNERVLVLTLTKRSAENLTNFLIDNDIEAQYLHANIKTLQRAELIKKLRLGEIKVLVGINLLREGLDLPEVSLVAILDADREGFLRNTTTLIQAIGRSARHLEGKVILYADKMTKSLIEAIQETERRREYQLKFNQLNNVIPQAIIKEIFSTPEEVLGIKKEIKIESREELEVFVELEEKELK
ncbi:MAG: UvrABC system protein B [Candidatus Parcubacteria bacterium]|nr:MAG: UvrABC system protein B [Candidatus Parcubacteria bacterium]